MTKIKLRYIQEYIDRHGQIRRYVRMKGKPNAVLPGLPGSPEFMAAYERAISSAPIWKSRFGARSVGQLVSDFYASAKFRNLAASSQATYRLILGKFVEKHGHRLVHEMPTDKIQRMIQDIGQNRPAMANLVRKILHRLMQHAIKTGITTSNPIAPIEMYRIGEYHCWTDDELARFEARWPIGSRERLAYALLLYTDQRGGDVVRMRRDIKDGTIKITQQKTGAELTIAIHPALARALEAVPARGLQLIGDAQGRPITQAALYRLMKRAARDAGLSAKCVPHGLRKALQRRLAERGATTKELQAVSGHKSLRETERYTGAADQARLFRQAIARLEDEK